MFGFGDAIGIWFVFYADPQMVCIGRHVKVVWWLEWVWGDRVSGCVLRVWRWRWRGVVGGVLIFSLYVHWGEHWEVQ